MEILKKCLCIEKLNSFGGNRDCLRSQLRHRLSVEPNDFTPDRLCLVENVYNLPQASIQLKRRKEFLLRFKPFPIVCICK
ncbi:hypothetical protein M514_04709 [Trichuris suis]|uniref:Uncharacterized protein n=1 Tax=Trichuris suis TaxID=68888 RepID=A0A085MAX0_9BILA|nr:hypothetical protein M513_04709 [Trichuris suis]KFD65807.1 hypothetical protein M514_04709 [Trichuris suis]